MLFVVGGAFVHLEKLLMDSRHKSSIGFGNKVGQLLLEHWFLCCVKNQHLHLQSQNAKQFP